MSCYLQFSLWSISKKIMDRVWILIAVLGDSNQCRCHPHKVQLLLLSTCYLSSTILKQVPISIFSNITSAV